MLTYFSYATFFYYVAYVCAPWDNDDDVPHYPPNNKRIGISGHEPTEGGCQRRRIIKQAEAEGNETSHGWVNLRQISKSLIEIAGEAEKLVLRIVDLSTDWTRADGSFSSLLSSAAFLCGLDNHFNWPDLVLIFHWASHIMPVLITN